MVDLIDLGLELQPEVDTTSWFLPLKIDTCPVMPSAPRARWLGTIAFDFAGLAQLASSYRESAMHRYIVDECGVISRGLLVFFSLPLSRGAGRGVIVGRLITA